MTADEVLVAEVARVRFATDDGGFAVLDATSDEGDPVVVCGPVAHVHAGDAIEARGAWREHPRHGRQFVVASLRVAEPTSDTALLAVLSSVRHVGPRGAAFLLQRHGAGVLDAVDADPHARLQEVPGIGPVRIGPAVEAWREARALRAVRLFLDAHDVPAAVAGRVVRALGAGAVDVLTVDPYRLTELDGVGFATADALARALGVAADDPRRLAAGVVHALSEAESDGHCHLPADALRARARRLLGPADVDAALASLAQSGAVVVEARDASASPTAADPPDVTPVDADPPHAAQIVSGARLHRVETRLADRIRALLDAEPAHGDAPPERPTGGAFAPTDAQWHAVQRALDHRLSILTGGPGVGKCVVGTTPVVLDGDVTAIEHVWRDHASEPVFDGEGWWASPRRPLTVPALDAGGRMVAAPVRRLYRQRISERGRRVTLQDGSQVVATRRHRFLGIDGWVSDVAVGDLVCVPGRLPVERGRAHDELMTLLAWQIAEGHESCRERGGRDTAIISQRDVGVLRRLRVIVSELARREGLTVGTLPIYAPEGRTPSLHIGSVAYRRFLERHGYRWGERSRTKVIPPCVTRAEPRAVRVFLREFFAAEAHVAPRGRVELTSASQHLVRQLAMLLRRFGVWMRMRTVRKAATNGTNVKRTYYECAITGPSMRRFADLVGIADRRKDQALRAACERRTNTNVDVVPINDLLREAKRESGLSRQCFGLTSGYFTTHKQPSRESAGRTLGRIREICDGTAQAVHAQGIATLEGRAGHRYKAQTFAAFAELDRTRLAEIAAAVEQRVSREVFYSRVVAVEEVHIEGWVYDLEVAEHHNYVAGGMLCHNTAALRTLVEVLAARRLRAKLCAPTGKAARRMAEATGAEASTIHRLLGWQPGEGFVHGPGDPIPGADVLIVDEASMLDVYLAGALFGAVGDRTHVVLVGDPDQLAPVGPGRVLDDLLASEEVPVTRLTEVFRQAARSLIVRTAHAFNDGRPVAAPTELEVERDYYFVRRAGPAAIFAEVVSLAAGRLPDHLGLDARADVQVLAPMHKGPAGIEAFNEALRAELNPDGQPIPGTGLRVGDRVVQTRNDHELQLMNGEIGVLLDHDREEDRTLLATDDGRMLALTGRALDTLRLAHAMSVHKAQGSSAPAIVVPITGAHRIMLTRNLVYTALTRAERMAVFVGEPAALELALRRVDARLRHTRLRELVVR